MSEEQKIVIIAGPNGAGKTTFAREFLVREPLKKPAKQQRTPVHRLLFIKTVELFCNLLKRKFPGNRGKIVFEGPEKNSSAYR